MKRGCGVLGSYPPFEPIEWLSPPRHAWKLNLDAVWNPNSDVGGLGWVICDHLGRVRLVGMHHISCCKEVKILEAQAPYKGLVETLTHNLQLI